MLREKLFRPICFTCLIAVHCSSFGRDAIAHDGVLWLALIIHWRLHHHCPVRACQSPNSIWHNIVLLFLHTLYYPCMLSYPYNSFTLLLPACRSSWELFWLEGKSWFNPLGFKIPGRKFGTIHIDVETVETSTIHLFVVRAPMGRLAIHVRLTDCWPWPNQK